MNKYEKEAAKRLTFVRYASGRVRAFDSKKKALCEYSGKIITFEEVEKFLNDDEKLKQVVKNVF